MNTREKIVDPSSLRRLNVTLAAGYFDPLLAWHAERLSVIRTEAETLVALILPLENALLPASARAELAAALRVIDYVLILPGADADAVERLVGELKPAQFFRLDEEELSRRGELMAHVRSRQIR